MKLTVNRKLFLGAIGRAASVARPTGAMEVLGSVLLDARADVIVMDDTQVVNDVTVGRLTITGTDLDVTHEGDVKAAVLEGGIVVVDAKRLLAIIKAVPGDDVHLSEADGKLTVKHQHGDMVLLCGDASAFPQIPGVLPEMSAVDASALSDALRRTNFCASGDDSRPNLNGVYLHIGADGDARAVATDGHRLAQSNFDIGEFGMMDGIIIPRKGVEQALAFMAAFDGVSVGFDGMMVFASETATLRIRLIDAAFPDYRQVIPKPGHLLTVDRREMRDAIKRLLIIASDRTCGAVIDVGASDLTITSDVADVGKASESVMVDEHGCDDVTIAVNMRYLDQALAACSTDLVTLDVLEALRPMVIREVDGSDSLWVIMPMRI